MKALRHATIKKIIEHNVIETQEELAERINRSPGFMGQVEAPNIVAPISLNTLFSIADVFEIPPYKLLDFDDVK